MAADPVALSAYDIPRNAKVDRIFANGMETGMGGYEQAIADRKRALFSQLFERLPRGKEATVVEVGMGTFPNARYGGAGRPRVDRAWFQCLKLQYDESLSSFAFNSNLRRYSEVLLRPRSGQRRPRTASFGPRGR